jgi:acyl-CoA dehydrogenase
MSSFPRIIFTEDHEQFRQVVRRFCEERIMPFHAEWAEQHQVPRALWLEAGALGMLNAWLPEEYGGIGQGILFDLIVVEELGRAGATGPGFHLHSMMSTPYIAEHGCDELKARILPKMVSGEYIGAIGFTEPGTGSDLANIKTRAEKHGNGWKINGQKTFITNGQNADIVVTACVTDPTKGAKGISMIVIEAGMDGFKKGRNLNKIGQHANDTAELFFEDVVVPAENLLGQEGHGFFYMMDKLAQERLTLSVHTQARAEAVLEWTIAYVKARNAFGQRVIDFQNTRFKLAEMKTQLFAGRAFCDALIKQKLDGNLDSVQAAAGKLFHSELLGRVTDECVQLHGGYGYMAEYPVAQAYVDARIERIYAGTSEIMKEIIGRSLDTDPN